MARSVFRELLGTELDGVSGALKRFSDAPTAATGSLDVRHHTGRTARFFIWLLGLPKEGTNQPTTVAVKGLHGVETWNRKIGASKFRTRHAVVDGLLEERAGKFRFLHKVAVVDGGIKYTQERVYFLGVRLPHLFSPIIVAFAKGDDHGWTLDLTVSCPRCGPICEYSGWIEVS